MNERLAAALLAAISAALIGAETILALVYGFDPGLILFCLAIYAGAAGLLFSVKLLFAEGGSGIESVSERRARAKRGGGTGGILEGYDVDEEFLGRGRGARQSGKEERPIDDEALKAAITTYAGMAGGLSKLLETLESIDEAAFRAMARSAGMAGVTRERAVAMVSELLAADANAKKEVDEAPTLKISLDQESFDDYIRRSMNEPESGGSGEGGGFSIGLDADDLSGRPSAPPTEFSHDPKAVFAKIGRPGGER